MKNYFSKLIDQLEKEITKISNSNQTEIQKCEACIRLVLEYYQQLRKFASDYQFRSEKEEIEYFRSLKPELVATLMYYYKKSKITKQNSLNNCKMIRKALQFELQRVEKFYSNHLEFISYYNSGKTNYDEVLFLRKNMDPSSIPTYILLHDDSNHTTNGDHLVAKLILNTKLYKFIQNELNNQSKGCPFSEDTKTIKSDLKWTAPKSALIELIYALYCKGVINEGDVEIKKLIKEFEVFFNIDLGDPYRQFINIKQRKKSSAVFLESLTNSLVNYINEQYNIP